MVDQRTKLLEHMAKHTPEDVHYCSECNSPTPMRRTYDNTTKWANFDFKKWKIFECVDCHASMATMSIENDHIATIHDV